MSKTFQDIIDTFTAEIEKAVTERTHERLARALIMGGFPGSILTPASKTPAAMTAKGDVKMAGKRVVELTPSYPPAPKKPRKKGPIQLCPVPRCKGRAAPVFHMLCGKHKDTPKKLVAQYRAARRERSK